MLLLQMVCHVEEIFLMVRFIIHISLQVGGDNRQLVFLYERGKKKLMDGSRIAFPSKHVI
jgi:phage/plasmid primase-like uncharacterized protein